MGLVSTLRGGQQRYMPLLVSKIHETMPNAPSYGVPSMPGSSQVSEVYEGSQHTNSAPNSTDSTPFGSPPLSAVSNPGSFFGNGFPQDLGISGSTTPSTFAGVVMTSSVEYGDVAVSAPMQMFTESSILQGAIRPPKIEPDG